MDVTSIGALAGRAAMPATRSVAVSGAGFDRALDDALRAGGPPTRAADRSADVDALVGQQLSPPPGGCSCDAMAAAAAPSASTVWRPVARDLTIPSTVQPGDLLLLASDGASERLHAAIVRSATEMIAPDANGLVGVSQIPWGLVREVRRPL